MTRNAIWIAALIAASIQMAGCKGANEDFAPAILPKTFAFEGKVEPKYVGTWHSTEGHSTVDILKDGALKVETVTQSVAGKSVVNVSGQWLASGDNLMFRYQDKSHRSIVLKYAASVSGNTLVLQQATSRLKTSYHRS